MRQCRPAILVGNKKALVLRHRIPAVKPTDRIGHARPAHQRALPVQTVDAGHTFQRLQNRSQTCAIMHAYRLAVRLLVFRFATGRRTGDDLDIGVAQIANGMHQRPHGNGFPIAGRVVVEQYELPDHIIRQRAVGRLVNHAPGHGIWCKQFIDERNNMLLVDIRAEHILAEFLQQLRAHGLMRNNKMQIREELLQHLGIVADRIHNVIPASGVHVPRRR